VHFDARGNVNLDEFGWSGKTPKSTAGRRAPKKTR
jgi:hypothetical protein